MQSIHQTFDELRHRMAAAVCQILYPRFKFPDYGRAYLFDEEFLDYCRTIARDLCTLDRRYALDQLIKPTIELEGDTAEAGIFRGASSYLICRRTAHTKKTHHLFDSFEGLSRPGPYDGHWWHQGGFAADERTVRKTLSRFSAVAYHKGWIPQVYEGCESARFSFVHIDVDFYEPTLASYAFFYKRMVAGGIIVCDDYGIITCPGAKTAVDEFMSDKPEPVICLPTGQAVVIRR